MTSKMQTYPVVLQLMFDADDEYCFNQDSSQNMRFMANFNFVAHGEFSDWIVKNKDKFQGTVHGPVYQAMTCHNALHHKYLNNAIDTSIFFAFVCPLAVDWVFLLRQQQRLFPNLRSTIFVPARDSNNNSTTKKPISHETLQVYGVGGYLDELFMSSAVIKNVLNDTCSLSQRLFAMSEIDKDKLETLLQLSMRHKIKSMSTPSTVYHFDLANGGDYRTMPLRDFANPLLLKHTNQEHNQYENGDDKSFTVNVHNNHIRNILTDTPDSAWPALEKKQSSTTNAAHLWSKSHFSRQCRTFSLLITDYLQTVSDRHHILDLSVALQELLLSLSAVKIPNVGLDLNAINKMQLLLYKVSTLVISDFSVLANIMYRVAVILFDKVANIFNFLLSMVCSSTIIRCLKIIYAKQNLRVISGSGGADMETINGMSYVSKVTQCVGLTYGGQYGLFKNGPDYLTHLPRTSHVILGSGNCRQFRRPPDKTKQTVL